MYLNLSKGKVKKTIEITEHLLADVDGKGNVIGIEMLEVSSQQSIKSLREIIKKGVPVEVVSGALVPA